MYFTELNKPGGTLAYVGISSKAWGVVVVQIWRTWLGPGIEIPAHDGDVLRLQLLHDRLQLFHCMGFRYAPAEKGRRRR